MSVITITNDNFENEVLKSDKPVIIDFWATWCGPCRMLTPVIEEIAKENDSIKICKVNVDDVPELAKEFSVMSIPMLIAFKNGKQVKSTVGVQSKNAILSMVE